MATIKLSDQAPKDGPITFVFGQTEFSLKGDESYETVNPSVVSDASNSPLLSVDVAQEQEQATIEYDPTDPHQNPAADHLSAFADPDVKTRAAEVDRQIQHQAYPDDPRYFVETEEVPEPKQEPQPPVEAQAPQQPSPAPTQQEPQRVTQPGVAS